MKWGVIKGITTNQKIFSMERGIDYRKCLEELTKFNVPVSVELTKTNETVKDLIAEARDYNRFPNVVIKVPMWKDGHGLEVAKRLLQDDIKVNMTCLIDINQAILGCELGVAYISLFYNRMIDHYKEKLEMDLDEATENALSEINGLRHVMDKQKYQSKLICGSIRETRDVKNCIEFGAHIVTVPPKILEKLPFHEKTESTIEEFDKAWKEWNKK